MLNIFMKNIYQYLHLSAVFESMIKWDLRIAYISKKYNNASINQKLYNSTKKISVISVSLIFHGVGQMSKFDIKPIQQIVGLSY